MAKLRGSLNSSEKATMETIKLASSQIDSLIDERDTLKAENEALKAEMNSKWINVDDQLPELGEQYNVICDLKDGEDPVSSTFEWDSIRKVWIDWAYPDGAPGITHWQPLPSPKL